MTFFGSAWRTKNENSAPSAQTQSAPGTISVHGDSPVAGAADVTTTSVAVGVVGAGSVAAGSEVGGALARAPPGTSACGDDRDDHRRSRTGRYPWTDGHCPHL